MEAVIQGAVICTYLRVGWSDLALFDSDCRNWKLCCQSGIYLGGKFPRSSAAQAQQSFYFLNHRDLKKFIIFLFFANTFLLLQRTIAKQKIRN